MQRFVKGRTNNHLTWVMVDSTDFATPESALSAATKIKIYGKTAGATGVNFVSSGTGSLTNDIQHVGASALGIYTIALAKADLSDASAAWYDQYVISLSATGAAYQTLVVDGGILESYLSAAQSDTLSAAVALSDAVSNVMSAVLLTQSLASDAASAAAQVNSRVLLLQSAVSDVDSALTSQFNAISSIESDIYSNLSDLKSDFQSRVPKAVATNSQLSDLASDIKSAVAAITVSLDASNISDIASAVVAALPITSDISDIYSLLSSLNSEFLSRVPKETAARSQLSDLHSDLRSFVVVMSGIQSDIYSALSDFQSDFGSRVPKAVATNSQLSDLHSDLRSFLVVMSGIQSDVYSALSDFQSDFASRVPKAVATNSQLSDLASDLRSVIILNASAISDLDSALTSQAALNASSFSDLQSMVTGISAILSDTYSALTTARAEPGVSAPAATAAPLRKIDFLYKAWRNTQQQDATSYVLYNDDGTTPAQKATVADDTASFTRGEIGSA